MCKALCKVQIDSEGSVIRDGNKIGTIPGFGHTDYWKHPNMVKNYTIKLDDGSHVKLTYGGFTEQKNTDGSISKKFIESCHAKCPSNAKHCFMHGANTCPHGGKLKDAGFFIIL